MNMGSPNLSGIPARGGVYSGIRHDRKRARLATGLIAPFVFTSDIFSYMRTEFAVYAGLFTEDLLRVMGMPTCELTLHELPRTGGVR